MADNTVEITTPITKIQQNGTTKIYDLGAIFKNIYLDIEEDKLVPYTLQDFYNELKSFFDKGDFILCSNKEPTDTRVKVWYQTVN